MGTQSGEHVRKKVLEHPVTLMVAEKLAKTPAQVVLRWGVQMGHSVVPKTKTESPMKENLAIFNWSIPDDMLPKFSEIEQASTSSILLRRNWEKSLAFCIFFVFFLLPRVLNQKVASICKIVLLPP